MEYNSNKRSYEFKKKLMVKTVVMFANPESLSLDLAQNTDRQCFQVRQRSVSFFFFFLSKNAFIRGYLRIFIKSHFEAI